MRRRERTGVKLESWPVQIAQRDGKANTLSGQIWAELCDRVLSQFAKGERQEADWQQGKCLLIKNNKPSNGSVESTEQPLRADDAD